MLRFLSKPKIYIIIAIILIPIIIIHIYLGVWVKNYINKQMADLNGYSGSIEDIDIHLWRGAYKIDGLKIFKTQGGIKEPFFSAKTTDVSVEWKALFHGAIVAEVKFDQPKLNFSKEQTGTEAEWDKFMDSLAPFDINRVDVKDGKLAYIDHSAKPEINLFVDNIDGKVTNLNNIEHEKNPLPSDLTVTGKSIGGGNLTIDGNMNILTFIPSFDIDLKLTKAELSAFNDFVKDSAAITFEKGTIEIFCEIASTKGELKGYVKPILNDVDLIDLKTDKNPLSLIWQSLVSLFIEAFENQSKDQFAMRIPIEGKLEKPEQNSWKGFLSIFSNAFGKAFSRNVDGTVNFRDILVNPNK